MSANLPPTPTADLLWSDERLLGFGPMDRTHEDFYRLAFDLLTCHDGGAGYAAVARRAIAAFEAHAVAHFGEEERWMQDSGFPAAGCHVDEHAAVLASVREVRAAVDEGRAGADLLRRLAEHLFTWFPAHADYMDSALAAWMCKRTLGGQPVVLRRQRD